MIEKFSKPSVAVITNKTSFFKENAKHLSYVRGVNELYIRQPQRAKCKNCDKPLSGADFTSHNVSYVVCGVCSHLNGIHDDTEEFSNFLYKEDDGEEYAENYISFYDSKVLDIYIPKVEFMLDVLGRHANITNLSVLDVGCGGGHFIKACDEKNVEAWGVEANLKLVTFGNKKLGKIKIESCSLNDFERLILESDHDVIGLIGVLEHLRYPRHAMKAFRDSKAKWMYLQVPLFSFSVFLEHLNQDVFPRQLNAGHTHLYTKESIAYLCNEFDIKIIGEWWFGTDMVDLLRQLIVKSKFDTDEKKSSLIEKYVGSMVDELQHVLDINKLCSGVNLILSK